MRPDFCSNSTGLFRAGLVFAGLLFATARTLGGDILFGSTWQNLEVTTYAPNSNRKVADCKVERIFLDHRKIGFFRVRLLPVLVAQGVRVEFGDPHPTNEWRQSFQSDWLPKAEHGAVEWRDLSIGSPAQGSPRLHAGVAHLTAAGSPTICKFQDVTLEANGATQHMAQAELRNDAGRPWVVWQDGGNTRRCDLFSGETPDNPKSNKAEK